jgi:hypothetical protein
MEHDDLVNELAKAIDQTLAQQLVAEAIANEEAFKLKKWGSAELNGGRFAEVAARIMYSVDSRNVNLTKSVDDCFRYIENPSVSHGFPEPQAAIHLTKVIRSIYKLRSQRGAVHVSPTYTANEIDSRLVVESVRWTLAELLRLFITSDPQLLAETVRSLARFPSPLIRIYGERAFLQSTTFTIEEEALAHLMFSAGGLTAKQIVDMIPKDPSTVRKSIKKLCGAKLRQIIAVGDKYQITDLGINRIEVKVGALS